MHKVSLSDHASHILVVDDDDRIRQLLARYLQQNGYRIASADHVKEARHLMDDIVFDLVILDIMMPGEDGLSFARSLRKQSNIPILMLTAKAETTDRITGLEIGIDDYLIKPFDPRELLLRINSILRRVQSVPEQNTLALPETVIFGEYHFHIERGELRQKELVLRITERERDILRILARAMGKTIPRETFYEGVTANNERTIDVQINRLRRKIEPDPSNPIFLQTVRGIGYKLLLEGQL